MERLNDLNQAKIFIYIHQDSGIPPRQQMKPELEVEPFFAVGNCRVLT
jgi:hypothetical protein